MMGLAAILAAYAYEVVARYGPDSPTVWSTDLVSYLILFGTFMAMSEVTRTASHVAVSVVLELFPPVAAVFAGRVIALAGAVVCAFLAHLAFGETMRQADCGVRMIAAVLPLSVLVINIATLANVSVAGLRIAGVISDLLLATHFLTYTLARVQADPSRAPMGEDAGDGSRLIAFVTRLPFLIIVASVMGLSLSGIATQAESAATGVIGAMITPALFGKLTLKMIVEALRGSAMIIVIIASSTLLSQRLVISGASVAPPESVSTLDLSPVLMLLNVTLGGTTPPVG